MAIKMTELKKSLREYDQKELIQLISELYKLNEDVKAYLYSKFKGEEAIQDLYEKTKRQVKNEFFPDKGFGKLRLSDAKKAISNFKKITKDQAKTVDLMLYYVELGTEFTCTFGDIDPAFYNSMLSMYSKVALECDQSEERYAQFKERLYRVTVMSNGVGWGYNDGLWEIYLSIGWVADIED
ncbi:DUF6155 family protein [Metabacillus sp. RGM 3146]|uniref:DUF6155 family protein n=1 Tax=Metabacillus sp. RGM 3146 TaxID=3401092 RepID=UPI003B9D7BC6